MAITNEQYMTLVRAAMNFGGGLVVASGAMSGNDMAAATAVILPLASVIWGWMVHTPEATVVRADKLKAQGVV